MSNESEAVMRTQRRKKQDAVDKFGGCCQLCGYNKCLNALEFHHLEIKKEKPSYIIFSWSWNRAKEELNKCILLCANCHREIHDKQLDISLKNKYIEKLKTFSNSNWIEKECPRCKCKYETKLEKQVYCTNSCSQITSRKIQRPSKEELKILILNHSFVKIGEMFNVSDNAIRKWAKSYGLAYRLQDIKNMQI